MPRTSTRSKIKNIAKAFIQSNADFKRVTRRKLVGVLYVNPQSAFLHDWASKIEDAGLKLAFIDVTVFSHLPSLEAVTYVPELHIFSEKTKVFETNFTRSMNAVLGEIKEFVKKTK